MSQNDGQKKQQNGKRQGKRKYERPSVQSERVELAGLAKACNGRQAGNSGRKAVAPSCTVLMS